MTKLVDMKRTKADKEAEKERWSEPYAGDDYGYGLSITLDDSMVKKLGVGDLDAGQKVTICGECEITADRVETISGKKTRSITLQIQKLGLEQGEASDVVKTLYGE